MTVPTEKEAQDNSEREEIPAPVQSKRLQITHTTKALLTVLAVVAVVVSAVFVYPYLVHLFGKQKQVISSVDQLMKQDVALRGRIKHLSALLESFENVNLEDIASNKALKALEQKVAAFEQQLTTLQKTHSGDEATQGELKTTIQRIEALEAVNAKIIANTQKVPMILGAFTSIKHSMQRPASFIKEFTAIVQYIDEKDPAIKSSVDFLREAAQQGLSTIQGLRVEFATLSAKITKTKPSAEKGWWNQLVGYAQNVVVVRKPGDGTQPSEDLKLGLKIVDQKLAVEDLEGAIEAADKLIDKDNTSYAVWRNKANRRNAAQRIVAELEEYALTHMFGSSEGK